MNDKRRTRYNRKKRTEANRKRLAVWLSTNDGSPAPSFCYECAYVECRCDHE